MTAYQKLYPKFESYPEAVRQAKRLKGLTIDALVESAGVSYSSVSRLCDGTQLDPKLYNSVALCKVLGLSMDEIFGLSASEASAEELQAKLHAAELENARLAEANKFRAGLLSARTPIIYILLVACVLQSCALIAYLFIDAHILGAGLIRFGDIGFVAWLLIGLILAAIGSCVWATMRFARKSSKRSADPSSPAKEVFKILVLKTSFFTVKYFK